MNVFFLGSEKMSLVYENFFLAVRRWVWFMRMKLCTSSMIAGHRICKSCGISFGERNLHWRLECQWHLFGSQERSRSKGQQDRGSGPGASCDRMSQRHALIRFRIALGLKLSNLNWIRSMLMLEKTPELHISRDRARAITNVNRAIQTIVEVLLRKQVHVQLFDPTQLFCAENAKLAEEYFDYETGALSKFGRRKWLLSILRMAGLVQWVDMLLFGAQLLSCLHFW